MSNNIQLLLTILVPLISLGAIFYLIPYTKKKWNINIGGFLTEFENILSEVKKILDISNKIAPSATINILEVIEKWAEVGTKKAEQMYLASQLTGDARNQSAIETVNSTLKQLNIPITDELQSVIKDVIESKVFDLKTDSQKAIATQDATLKESAVIKQSNIDLQNQLLQIQQTNAKLISEKTSLENNLQSTNSQLLDLNSKYTTLVNAIQSTVQPTIINNVDNTNTVSPSAVTVGVDISNAPVDSASISTQNSTDTVSVTPTV